MAASVNFLVENDADLRTVFNYHTDDGTPIDLTGAEFCMRLRRDIASATVDFELTTANGRVELIDGPTGRFKIVILQEELVQLPIGDFEQSMVVALDGSKWQIWRGTFTLNLGPSR